MPGKAQDVCRLRRLNAEEAGANKASALQSLVERVVQRERRNLRRPRLSKLRRSWSMVGPQRDDLVRDQIPPRVGQDRFRHRVTSKGLSVSGSARRRLWVQLNTGNPAEVHRPNFISRSPRRLVADCG